ncbi:hypothetical protein BDW75DRAFT_198461 [Aspergillus navahoensis]
MQPRQLVGHGLLPVAACVAHTLGNWNLTVKHLRGVLYILNQRGRLEAVGGSSRLLPPRDSAPIHGDWLGAYGTAGELHCRRLVWPVGSLYLPLSVGNRGLAGANAPGLEILKWYNSGLSNKSGISPTRNGTAGW